MAPEPCLPVGWAGSVCVGGPLSLQIFKANLRLCKQTEATERLRAPRRVSRARSVPHSAPCGHTLSCCHSWQAGWTEGPGLL